MECGRKEQEKPDLTVCRTKQAENFLFVRMCRGEGTMNSMRACQRSFRPSCFTIESNYFSKKLHAASRIRVDVHFAISHPRRVFFARSVYSGINLLAFIVSTSFFLCAIIHHFFMQFIRACYGCRCYRCNGVLTSHQVNLQ